MVMKLRTLAIVGADNLLILLHNNNCPEDSSDYTNKQIPPNSPITKVLSDKAGGGVAIRHLGRDDGWARSTTHYQHAGARQH